MTSAAILNFGQIAFLVTWSNSGCYLVQTQNLSQIPKSWAQLWLLFSKIQDGGRPPFWKCNDVN